MNKVVVKANTKQAPEGNMEMNALELLPQHVDQSKKMVANDPILPESLTQTDEALVEHNSQRTQSQINLTVPSEQSNGLAIVNATNGKVSHASKDSSCSEFGPIRVYLDQVKLYCQYQEWQKAIEVCQEILATFPDTAEAHKLWGNILQQSGDEIAAMGCYAKALMSDPHYPEVYANIGSIYAKREQWTEAVPYYQKALELNPRFAGAYRNLSKVWKQLGKTEKSTQYLVYALTLDPSMGTAEEFFRLGNYLVEKNKLSEGIQFYRIALEREPEHLMACQKLAELLEIQGDWKNSVEYYRKVLEIRSNESLTPKKKRISSSSPAGNVKTRLPQQSQIRQQGQHLPSNQIQNIQSLSKAAAADPQSFQHRVALGDAYASHQDWDHAIEAYRSALRINPKLADVYVKLGTSFSRLGKEMEMAESFHRAFEINPTLATVQQDTQLSQIFLKQGDFDRAVAALNRTIQRDPTFSDGYRQLGDVLNLKGDKDGAVLAYRNALQVQSGAPVVKKLTASPQPQR